VFGLVLLVAGIADLLIKAYPFKLMNPSWDLQLISSISEMMPIYLLGALILSARLLLASEDDQPLIRRGLAWSSIAVAVFLAALIPLMLTDSVRIANIASAQLGQQQKQALEQLNQAETAVAGINSPADLQRLNLKLRNPTAQGVAEFRDAAQQDLKRKRQELLKGVKANQEKLSKRQLRSNVRSGLGLLLGATCFTVLGRSLQQKR
jgi:hypothetical protein